MTMLNSTQKAIHEGQQGFTLVELLVGALVTSLTVAAGLNFLKSLLTITSKVNAIQPPLN